MIEIMTTEGGIHRGEIIKQYNECEDFKGTIPEGLGEFFLVKIAGYRKTSVNLYCIFPDTAKKIYNDPLWKDIVANNMCYLRFPGAAGGNVRCHLYSSGTSEAAADDTVRRLVRFWKYMDDKKAEWRRQEMAENNAKAKRRAHTGSESTKSDVISNASLTD